LFENSEIIFDKSKKLVVGQSLSGEVCGKVFVQFGLLESIADKPKIVSDDENFVLSLNTGLEMLDLSFVLEQCESF
jgi:hypothetical protein